jgi:GTP-binding protein
MIVLNARFELSAPSLELAPRPDLPEICFVGRSNVGKSSALNSLTNRHQLARVSKTPGRTRLLNFFRIDIADHPGATKQTAAVRFCDLPGYGFAKAPKGEISNWGKVVTEYLDKREGLSAVIMLIDSEVGPQPKDFEMVDFLASVKRTLIVVATKIDKLPRTRRGAGLDKLAKTLGVPRTAMIAYSAKENIGHDDVWRAICSAGGVLGKHSEQILEPTETSEVAEP